jgi:hypothetical protein
MDIEAALTPHGIRFNWETQTFENANGRISPEAVVEARGALFDLTRALHPRIPGRAKVKPGDFESAAERYLRLMPISTQGAKRELLGTMEQIHHQATLLTHLENGLEILARLRQDIKVIALLNRGQGSLDDSEEMPGDRTQFINWQ